MIRANIGIINGIVWDVDALTFISAAGITNYNQKLAVNYLATQLKANSLWTLISYLYPLVGSTSTINSKALKGGFTMNFFGTVTHDANGITTDGSTGYGNLGFNAATHLTLNDESLFLYSRTSAASPTVNEVDMGAAISTTQRDMLVVRGSSDGCGGSVNASSGGGNVAGAANTDGRGFYMVSRVSSTDLRFFKNGSQSGSTTTAANTGTRTNNNMFIGGRNVSNALSAPVARNYALVGAGKGFSVAQAATSYTIVQNYQTMLGRQV